MNRSYFARLCLHAAAKTKRKRAVSRFLPHNAACSRYLKCTVKKTRAQLPTRPERAESDKTSALELISNLWCCTLFFYPRLLFFLPFRHVRMDNSGSSYRYDDYVSEDLLFLFSLLLRRTTTTRKKPGKCGTSNRRRRCWCGSHVIYFPSGARKLV